MKRGSRKATLPSSVIAPAENAPLDRLFARQRQSDPTLSGVGLVEEGTDAFALRVLSARAAVRSLDLQYYIWHSDPTGQYLSYEVLQAANRGVRVRMLLDDMDARSRDGVLMTADQHPNIDIRLFNPFATRSGMLRTAAEVFSRGSRLNHRMHNKAWIADGRIALVGGRNIGDEYFAASSGVNFVDLDVVLTGAAVEDTGRAFDEYWNSQVAVPISHLRRTARNRRTLDELHRLLQQNVAACEAKDYVQRLHASPHIESILSGRYDLAWSRGVHVVADDPHKAIRHQSQIHPGVLQSIDSGFEHARRELLLISPYFVPGAGGTDQLRRKAVSGVAVSVLTNSLAATDVAAVHAGYSRYRPELLQAGIRLFELKPAPGDDDRDEGHERMRIGSSKASLHTKAAIVDEERLFVGSFNLDPRSATLNCEMGVWIHDPSLAQQLAVWFNLGATPQHSFVVSLDADGLLWTEQTGGVTRQYRSDPQAGWSRRFVTWVLRHLPIESQL